jgi:hypothetical protein
MMLSFKRTLKPIDSRSISRNADISIQHQLCNMAGAATQQALPCAFRSHDDLSAPIKQMTLVREPVSRAVSVYYFWGELFKLKTVKLKDGKVESINNILFFCSHFTFVQLLSLSDVVFVSILTHSLCIQRSKHSIGQVTGGNETISNGKFDYHGDETTPPPAAIARGECFTQCTPFKDL